MALTLDLKNMFLKVLNPSQIYSIKSKVHFVKGLANYIKLGQIVSSHNMLVKNLCIKLHSLAFTVTALKIILIYVQGCEKRKLKHVYTDWMKIRTENLIFLNLDRQGIYRVAVKYRAKATFLQLFLSQIFMALTLDLNNIFLKVLNPSQIYPIKSKVHFVK